MTEYDLEIIETYLNGKLNAAEKTDFERRLESDPEFRSTVLQMKASIISIRQAAFDEKLAILKEEEETLQALDRTSFVIRPMYRWVAVAAILLAAIFLVGPLLKSNDTIDHPYLAEHFDEFIIHDTYKGSKEDARYAEIMRGYNLFAEKEFEKAIPVLKNNWETHKDTISLFYLWVSAVGTDNSNIESEYGDEIKLISGNNKYSKYLNSLK